MVIDDVEEVSIEAIKVVSTFCESMKVKRLYTIENTTAKSEIVLIKNPKIKELTIFKCGGSILQKH